ncbi:MAG: Hpt domain-containing protein, partial [Rhodanobacteraceae bacterium]
MSTATGSAGVAALAADGPAGGGPGGAARASAMQLEDHIDFSTLGWVKPQIDQLLSEARQALEAFAEAPGESGLMHSCAGLLHQVLGTLRIVELYGAAELAQEMEHLAQAVLDGQVASRDDALGVLMRGLVQLPDYLDLIDAGHKDIPVVLLPLLNELRDARGAEPVDTRVLFHPDLDRALPEDADGARAAYPFADLRRHVITIRERFQVPLLAWTQGKPPDFAAMRDCMDALRPISHAGSARRLWWIAAGVLDALEQGRLDHHLASLRQQFAHLDRALRRVQDEGEDVCDDEDARELTRTLLYAIAQAAPGAGRSDAISRCFALDGMVPSGAEFERARAAMSGRNRALLDTVAKAVRDDLLRVKEGLDIFLRREDRNPQQLATHLETLQRVGDTLRVLGLETPAGMIAEQRRTIAEILDGGREARPETILDIASALLYVDASLEHHSDRLGADERNDDVLPPSEARKIMRALMREAGANLGKVKDHITAFIESSWSHAELAAVPKLLAEVGGALRILNLERPADLVDGIDRYIDNELIVDRAVPTVEAMNQLADAVAAVEYYLEIGHDANASDSRILDGARHSLESLGYWPVPVRREPAKTVEAPETAPPVPAETATPSAVPTESAPAPMVPGTGPGHWIEVDEEVMEPVDGGTATVDTSFQDVAGIDAEIREVFIEEVGEEIANLSVNLPTWKSNPEDLDTLNDLRRSFHTLKGSGRLVGAAALGEFSWKIENMLNRVLDHTIQPDANVQALADAAVATLPKLHTALQGECVTLDPPLEAIMQTADRLAAGEPARIADLQQAYRTVVRKVRRWVPLSEPAPDATVVEPVEPVPVSSAPGLPVVDPILLDVLRTEVAQHLAGMRAYMARDAGHDVPVDDELARSVHTLHGAVAMVGIESLAGALAPAEAWIHRVHGARAALDREGCDALRDAIAMTEYVLAQFDAPAPDVPDTTALTERLERLRDHWSKAVLPESRKSECEAEAERAAADQAGQARIAAEKAEQERVAAEHAEHERLAAERAEQERVAAEQAEQERVAAEQAELERVAAEKAEQERSAAEQAEQERVAA